MNSCSRLLYKEYTFTRLSYHIYSWYTIYNCTPRPTCYSRKGHSRHTQFRAVGHPNNTSWWVAINNNQIMQPGLKFIQDVFRWNIKQASYFLNKNIQITIFKIFFHSMYIFLYVDACVYVITNDMRTCIDIQQCEHFYWLLIRKIKNKVNNNQKVFKMMSWTYDNGLKSRTKMLTKPRTDKRPVKN